MTNSTSHVSSSASPNFREEFSAKIPALTLLMTLGYRYLSPQECLKLRSPKSSSIQTPVYSTTNSSNQVMLLPVLRQYLTSQTFPFEGQQHHLSDSAINKVISELNPAMNLGLTRANETLYDALLYGVNVTEFIDGKRASPTIQLIDWQNIENNAYHVTEEMVVQNADATGNVIPDIVCFVNGLPLVVIEAKRPDSNNPHQSTNAQAISQHIRNQGQKYIPHLFAYSQLLLTVNGHDGLYGTCGTPKTFWSKWIEEEISEPEFYRLKNQRLDDAQIDHLFAQRSAFDKREYQSLLDAGELAVTDQDRLIISLLRPDRLLDMTRYYTLFDSKAGKIVARYQQVFGIKALVKRMTQFDGPDGKSGSRKGGVIWHTTGSGKSYTMVFLSKALIWLEELAKCRVFVVTDRVDLENQIARTFISAGALSDKDRRLAKALSGRDLAKKIGKSNERIIFSIINKFGAAAQYDDFYNPSENIIVLVDEGHRSQNGENNIRMQQALPNAAFIAFTGTPLLKDDKTENKFGTIIHSYTMQQAVADKTVTPLLYEERIPELNTNDVAIDKWFDRITQKLTSDQKADLKRKFSKKGQVYQVEGRIELIAHDISDHFQNFKQQDLKGQLACDSKVSAIRYKHALDAIGKVTSVVAMSPPDTREGHEVVDAESKDLVQNWWQDNVAPKYGMDDTQYTKDIIDAFGGNNGKDSGPDIMIVVDKLLTGFDEPKNTVLYIDKPLKSHNLIQAIARVNRLHAKKQFGYLIDYRGILKELDITIEKYQDLAERTQGGFDIEDLAGMYHAMDSEYKKLPMLHKKVWGIFSDVSNTQDGHALRQSLSPKIEEREGVFIDTRLKKRDDFYAALTEFANVMKVALQSASYFEDSFFEGKRDRYKKDLKAFIELRKQIREDANETINFDEFEDDIRTLLNKHIAGIEVREAKGAYLVGNMGKTLQKACNPEALSDDEARNQTDKITSRVTKMIEQDLADDPYAQEHFSKLLKKAIEDAKAMFDAPVKQYMMFADFEEDVKARKVPDVPNEFVNESGKHNKHAQAYFGLFKHLFAASFLEENDLDNDSLVSCAYDIDDVVNKAVAENSLNPSQMEKDIRVGLLKLLFKAIGTDNAKKLSDKVIDITRHGISRGN